MRAYLAILVTPTVCPNLAQFWNKSVSGISSVARVLNDLHLGSPEHFRQHPTEISNLPVPFASLSIAPYLFSFYLQALSHFRRSPKYSDAVKVLICRICVSLNHPANGRRSCQPVN